MKLYSFVLLLCVTAKVFCCPDGWLAHTGSCYHFSHDTETWIAAEEACRIVFDAHLAEITTPEENLYIESQAKKRNTSFWIGLNDLLKDGSWVWVGSKQPLTGFSDWAPGEPNNYYQGEEGCALLYKELGYRWIDAACKWDAIHYICEKMDTDTVPIGK